jgi:hypothetical protein
MFYVVKETWGPGADPSDSPDKSKVLFASTLYEAAARIAEQHVARFGASGRDPTQNRWWARSPDELYIVRVTTSPPEGRSFQLADAEAADAPARQAEHDEPPGIRALRALGFEPLRS